MAACGQAGPVRLETASTTSRFLAHPFRFQQPDAPQGSHHLPPPAYQRWVVRVMDILPRIQLSTTSQTAEAIRFSFTSG